MSERRRYLPAEAYRFLVLAALDHRRGAPLSKGQIAWETRANHYMVTRVLADLDANGHVEVTEAPDGAYQIHATEAGRRFLHENAAYARSAFAERVAMHFRYGRAPAWLASIGAVPGAGARE